MPEGHAHLGFRDELDELPKLLELAARWSTRRARVSRSILNKYGNPHVECIGSVPKIGDTHISRDGASHIMPVLKPDQITPNTPLQRLHIEIFSWHPINRPLVGYAREERELDRDLD